MFRKAKRQGVPNFLQRENCCISAKLLHHLQCPSYEKAPWPLLLCQPPSYFSSGARPVSGEKREEGLEATSGHCCSAIHGRRIVVCPSEATAGEATSPPRNGTLAGHTCSGHPIIFFSPTKEFFIFFGKAFALCPQFIELILSFSLSRVWKRYFGKV